jgi:WhiB family transcriptional regulator, redox-sensing transcriptional regulator
MVRFHRELDDYLNLRRGRDVLAEMPEWMSDALCAQVDDDLFFPKQGGSVTGAKSVCARCPVRQKCLDYALDNGERYVIWGGLSELERRKVKRDRRTPEQIEAARAIRQRLRPDDLGAA